MNRSRGWSELEWSLSDAQRIDALCDDFERAWNSGSPRRIEELLAQHPELPRTQLLYELLRLERYLREQAGESPCEADARQRFPEDIQAVARAWSRGATLRSTDSDQAAKDRSNCAMPLSWPVPGSSPTNGERTETYVPHLPDTQDQPSRLGRFDIRGTLGRGGFGVVYRAYDPERGMEVALKVARSSQLADEYRALLAKEAQAGQHLDHPNLVKTLDCEQLDDQLLIVQQFIEGESLGDWHRRCSPSPRELVQMLIPVAQALGYLHAQGFVHRDLKPGNILIERGQRAMVADFGLTLHEADQRQRKGEYAGTREYMSPEQVRRQSHNIDGQSDVWSLGVILYRLLTDRLPFGGPPPRVPGELPEYWRELEAEILELDPKPPRMIRPGLSRRIEEICLRCLEKRKRDRYRTCFDLAEDLRLYLERTAAGDQAIVAAPEVRVVPKGLRAFDASDASFFLPLLPGPRTSEGLPASVAFWRDRLNGVEGLGPLDVGVVYGPSGCGKSSFVRAGLLPLLGVATVPLVIEATADDTEVRVLKALRQAIPGIPSSASLVDACQRISARGSAGGRKILLVLDQFEQWLQAQPDVRGSQLLEALGYANGIGLQLLLLVRDDYWMPLTRFLEQLEVPLREHHNLAPVDLIDRNHARTILAAFGRAYGRLPSEPLSAEAEQFLDGAVEGLAEGGRIICVRLALFAEMMKDRPWTPRELASIGGAQGIGVAFLEQTFGREAPASYRPHRVAARAILDCLLPPFGTELKGQARTIEELRAATPDTSRRNFDELLQILDRELKLITPFAPDKPDGVPDKAVSPDDLRVNERKQSSYYQLTHDYLVPSLRQWLTTELGRSRAGRATLRLRERSEDWNRHPEPRRLPSWAEWLAIGWHVPRRTWTDAQRRTMRAASRRFLTRIAAGMVILLGLGLFGWELQGRFQARSLRNELLVAGTSQLPEIATRIPPLERWARPLLESQYAAEFGAEAGASANLDADAYRRRLHLGLTLGPGNPARMLTALEPVTRIPPADLSAVGRLLAEEPGAVASQLGERLASAAREEPAAVLPWAALLVAVAPDDARLPPVAATLAEQLIAARSLQFPIWLRLLEPIGPLLREPLLARWQGGVEFGANQRTQLVEALVAFAGSDVESLTAAVQDARPEEHRLLLPPLKALGESARTELARRWRSLFPRPAVRPLVKSLPGWDAKFEAFVQEDQVQGVLGPRGAIALAVDQAAPEDCLERFAAAGFRPVSWRPYLTNGQRRATVGWQRDGREARVATGLTREQFEERLVSLAREQFQPVDLSFEPPTGDSPRLWSGVWVRNVSGEPEVRSEVHVDLADLPARQRELRENGFALERYVAYTDGDGTHRVAAIWRQLGPPQQVLGQNAQYRATIESFFKVRYERHFGDLSPGSLQVDLRTPRFNTARRDSLVPHVDQLLLLERTGGNRSLNRNEEAAMLTVLRRMGATGEIVRLLEPPQKSSGATPEAQLHFALGLAADGQLEALRAAITQLDSSKLPAKDASRLEYLKFRADILAGDADAAARRRNTFESQPNTLTKNDLVTVHALLAGLYASQNDSRADELRRKALELLKELASDPDFFVFDLPERIEWDSLRSAEEFQQLAGQLKVTRHFTGVWRETTEPVRSEVHFRQPVAEALESARRLLAEGAMPQAIEPAVGSDANELGFCSLWWHDVPTAEQNLRTMERLANLALAASQCGDHQPLIELFSEESSPRDARSFAIEWLNRSGYPISALQALLRQASPLRARCACLLALGEYPVAEASSELRASVREWAERDPDAAVRATAAWCLRRWEPATEEQVLQPAASTQAEDANWYRNGERQVMIRIAPSDFRIGSPSYEPGRETTEQQNWMRIPRRYALSETPVTARQFRRFVEDSNVKARLPGALYATLKLRNALTERMWHLDCPQGSLRRFDAMLYCEWLSEQEGIPPDQRCYPDIWEFANKSETPEAKKLPESQRVDYRSAESDLLTRRGYRLPTEAEFEYAARGGSSQSRFFGDQDALLGKYCWYDGNSNGRSQPVGRLKPNDYGFFDLLGNASAHCQDPYASYAIPALHYLRVDNLVSSGSGTGNYVLRGGDFESSSRNVRSARRALANPGNNRYTLGLRLARTED